MDIPEELRYWYISLLLSCYCVPPPTQCILNMTWYLHCMIKLKQLDKHLFYILFCPLARKPNFSLIVHLININTVFCWCDAFVIGFWMCFILWPFSFLYNIVLNLSLWFCLLCMLVPLEMLCDMAGFWLLAFITVVFFSRFKFTKVFSGNASQEHVYNDCVHDLVKDFISGQNCLLFACGTSSAGKTYTIQGTSKKPGIIPRAINVLFNSIRDQQSETCRIKPDMVTRVVELDDKAVKQEILYKQQIMAWSQNKNHVSLSRMVISAVRRSWKGPFNIKIFLKF